MCRRCFCCCCCHSKHRKRPSAVSGIKVDTKVDLEQNSSANGGLGGCGGVAYNCSDIEVNNIVVVLGGYPHTPLALSFGVNGTNLEITTDEDGSTLLNGIKMEEESLPDGTKVFLFKNKVVDSISN